MLIVLSLAPLWLVGIFGRGLWTPDEPREADIAWRMSLQSDRTLPQLAGRPFLEKPPLTYWMSAGALALWGDSGAAARVPNALYAVTAAVAIGALALAMQPGIGAAVIAALVAMSALTAFRASIWLAPDSCLLAGCALALLGAWRGYRTAPGPRKAAGYTLMHLGAAIGFMAKSAPGWLVPALALLTLIAWERRWSELRRWELYAGFALQALLIGPWLLAVVRSAQGADALRALFWHNLIGRFTRVAATAELDYTTGHRNFPGKYLLELPLYLLPWTLIVAAALVRAWQRAREPGPAGTPWRFALAASVPFLALLSLAATARDVYAAPAMLGFGLLSGLWVHDMRGESSGIEQLALRCSRWLVTAIAWALAGTLTIVAVAGAGPPVACAAAAAGVLAAAQLAMLRGARAQQADEVQRSVGWTYAGYAAALTLAALAALPVIDRWQDLPALARRIHADAARDSLALLDADETTIAILDRGLDTPFTLLSSGTDATRAAAADGARHVVGAWLAAHGRDARVLVLLPGHAPGKLSRWLERFHRSAPPGDGVVGRLVASGVAALVQRYELPQGRRYALLGPPP